MTGVDLGDYSGLWAVEPVRFGQMTRMANQLNLRTIAGRINRRSVGYFREGSTAVVDIQGTMTKGGSCLGGCSSVELRQAIRQANADPNVRSILCCFDTPGGTVAGTADLANEIRRSKKPVTGFVEDLCCSAGMWLASQCRQVFANNNLATVGSIGTFMGLYDVSKALEGKGVRAVVVKAGEFKGGGFPGAKISSAQVAEWQKQIDAVQEQFTRAISDGRRMSILKTRRLANGLSFLAKEAKGLGLIDGIKSFDEVVAGLN